MESKRFVGAWLVLSVFEAAAGELGLGKCRRTSKCVSSANLASRILTVGDAGEKSRAEMA